MTDSGPESDHTARLALAGRTTAGTTTSDDHQEPR